MASAAVILTVGIYSWRIITVLGEMWKAKEQAKPKQAKVDKITKTE